MMPMPATRQTCKFRRWYFDNESAIAIACFLLFIIVYAIGWLAGWWTNH